LSSNYQTDGTGGTRDDGTITQAEFHDLKKKALA
jgi:hypothetical protein